MKVCDQHGLMFHVRGAYVLCSYVIQKHTATSSICNSTCRLFKRSLLAPPLFQSLMRDENIDHLGEYYFILFYFRVKTKVITKLFTVGPSSPNRRPLTPQMTRADDDGLQDGRDGRGPYYVYATIWSVAKCMFLAIIPSIFVVSYY